MWTRRPVFRIPDVTSGCSELVLSIHRWNITNTLKPYARLAEAAPFRNSYPGYVLHKHAPVNGPDRVSYTDLSNLPVVRRALPSDCHLCPHQLCSKTKRQREQKHKCPLLRRWDQIISWPKHTSVNKGLSENHAASSEANSTINWSWWDPAQLASAQVKKVGTNSNSLLLTFQLGVRPWEYGIGGIIRKTGFEEQTLP